MKKLIVIYYHHIVETGKGYSYQRVEKEHFARQMQYLKEQGYSSLFFEDLEKPLPEKAVLITFDDGFRSVYENAAPIMKELGLKMNVYLPTKYVEEEDPHFMTWEMLRELRETGCLSVAAHTHSHPDLRTLDDEGMRNEITDSSRLLRERLGVESKAFCIPFGKYDSNSLSLLKKAGKYEYIFASFYGCAEESKLTHALIPRIGISNDDTMEAFGKKLEGKYNWKGPVQRLRLFAANRRGERITEYEME